MAKKSNCYYHPDVETRLQCAECGKFICPKCVINAPVGYKCKECAKQKDEFKKEKIAPVYAYGIALATGSLLGLIIGTLKGFGFLVYWSSCYLLGYALARIITYFLGYSYNPKKIALSGLITFVCIALNPIKLILLATQTNVFYSVLLLITFSFSSMYNVIGVIVATWAGSRHIKF